MYVSSCCSCVVHTCTCTYIHVYYWCTGHSPPIQEVIDTGCVPRVVEFLTSDNPFIQVQYVVGMNLISSEPQSC